MEGLGYGITVRIYRFQDGELLIGEGERALRASDHST